MGGSDSPTTTTTKTQTSLPDYLQGPASAYMDRAGQLASQPYQPYQGTRISPLAPEQQAGLAMTTQRALTGNAGMNAAQGNLADTMNGAYMQAGANPYLDGMFNQAATRMGDQYSRGTMAGTLHQFNKGGAFGGSAMNQQMESNNRAFGDSLGQLASNTYGQNYQQERARQMQGIALAPQMAANDYQDIQALQGVGDTRRQYLQDLLNQDISSFYDARNYPYQQLDVLGNSIGRLSGSGGQASATAPNPYQPNRTAGALGGAASGAAMGTAIMPGWGTAIGALAGGLLGYQ